MEGWVKEPTSDWEERDQPDSLSRMPFWLKLSGHAFSLLPPTHNLRKVGLPTYEVCFPESRSVICAAVEQRAYLSHPGDTVSLRSASSLVESRGGVVSLRL